MASDNDKYLCLSEDELSDENVEGGDKGKPVDADDEASDDVGDAPFFFSGSSRGSSMMRSKDSHNAQVLSEEEIHQRQETAVEEITKILLTVTPEHAAILLRSYKWNVRHATEGWFADEDKVRSSLGIFDPASLDGSRGNPSSSQGSADGKIKCGICFEKFAKEQTSAAACNHSYCNVCWQSYFNTAISNGQGCLSLRCPKSECGMAVGDEMIMKLAGPLQKQQFKKFILRSYVYSSFNVKWCPAPGCGFAVTLDSWRIGPSLSRAPSSSSSMPVGLDSMSANVECKCGHWFCWNCLEEPHRPVECDVVERWLVKNSEYLDQRRQNIDLSPHPEEAHPEEAHPEEASPQVLMRLLSRRGPGLHNQIRREAWRGHSWSREPGDVKRCPKCKRPIEKDLGCMHMTCYAPCKHEFCWTCLGDWKDHSYACNRYEKKGIDLNKEFKVEEPAKQSLEHSPERWDANETSRKLAVESQTMGDLDEEVKLEEGAQQSLDRYLHYFERWDANENSRKKAVESLTLVWASLCSPDCVEESYTKELRDMYNLPPAQLDFLIKAWEQIVECRRVLKWTYCFGYYMEDDDEQAQRRREFFEHLQGQAEASLGSLHKCAEKDIFLPPVSEEQVSEEEVSEEQVPEEQISTWEKPSFQAFLVYMTQLIDLTGVTKNYFNNLVKALENGLSEIEEQLEEEEARSSRGKGEGKEGDMPEMTGGGASGSGSGSGAFSHDSAHLALDQGQADASLGSLHKCAEKDIISSLPPVSEEQMSESEKPSLQAFSAVKRHTKNLVKALKNGW